MKKPKKIKRSMGGRRGRPRVADEDRRINITISLERSIIDELDAVTRNRSGFVRDLILDELERED